MFISFIKSLNDIEKSSADISLNISLSGVFILKFD